MGDIKVQYDQTFFSFFQSHSAGDCNCCTHNKAWHNVWPDTSSKTGIVQEGRCSGWNNTMWTLLESKHVKTSFVYFIVVLDRSYIMTTNSSMILRSQKWHQIENCIDVTHIVRINCKNCLFKTHFLTLNLHFVFIIFHIIWKNGKLKCLNVVYQLETI